MCVNTRILNAFLEVMGRQIAAIDDAAAMTTDITNALAGIPLFAPLLAGITIMALDFDAAEQAVDREFESKNETAN